MCIRDSYLYGVGLDWEAPGFTYFKTNLYQVKINNHTFFADSDSNGYVTQLTVSAAYPFSLGDQDFVVDGLLDWRSPSRDAGTQTSVGSSIQVKWDAGKACSARSASSTWASRSTCGAPSTA